MKITRYLDPDQGQGGQGATGLENSVFGSFGATKPVEGATPPEGGTGAPATPPDAATVAAEQATLETLLNKETSALTAEEKTTLENLKGKFNIEELNEDGTAMTAEQKAALETATKRVSAILAKPEAQRTMEEVSYLKENTTPEVNVYEEVDQLSGIPVTVEYGNISPSSPEGILKRETVIREQAMQEYDAQLKADVPLAYQFMLHLKAGGNADDFMLRDTENYQEVVLAKQDSITQEKIYRKALSLKGNTPDQIDALIQHAKDKGKLFEYSGAELTALQRKQLTDEQARTNAVKQQEIAQRNLENSFFIELDKSIKTGVQGVVIPPVDQKPFAKYLQDNVYVQGGKLLYVRELDPKNLQEDIAADYFRFKKGNLKALAERKAISINTESKRAKITYKLTPKAVGDTAKKFVSFNQV